MRFISKPMRIARFRSGTPGIPQNDRLRSIDHRRRSIDIRLHRDNLLALDQHIGFLEITEGCIEGRHHTTLQQ